MQRRRLAPIALSFALALAGGAQAASLTPPNLVTASSLNNADLLLVWPSAAGGPLEAMSWSVFKSQMSTALAGSFLTPGNNLSDVGNPTIARTNLGLGTAATAATGSSGATLPFLNVANTWSGAQTIQLGASGVTAFPVRLQNPANTIAANGVGIDFDATGNSFGVRSSQIFALQNPADNGSALHLDTNAAGAGPADALVLSSTKTATFSGEVILPAATTGTASINIPHGSAPTSPVNGDLWTTTSGVFARVNGATQQVGGVTVTSWTPVITFATPGNLSVSYSAQNGETLKIAGTSQSVCIAFFNLTSSAFTFTTASGNFQVTGLSPAANGTWSGSAAGATALQSGWTGLGGSSNRATPYLGSTTAIQFDIGNSNNASAATTATFTSGTNIAVSGSITYAC